ncbi:PFL_4669 family integrating conjugative element protein [Candidatus Thiodiazotropha sp. LNASS1]|uniref:PFL_4669 family integrating conjugative element protein n=1 Tax=Candidatus Thiodiazotropha sp. LNASS1 TaxID=3096260 RepID=UPI000D36A7C2|nr:MAG: TIGR03761 family integrating conjugative element protein [gamma proteobacterium symbiont of Ctena orbiculata]
MNSQQAIPQEKENTATGVKQAADGPGALRGQAWLTVQTRQAQQLIRGRNSSTDKPAIIGLVGFADRLRVIWQAARDDDPYADWWLIKVHQALDQARGFIGSHQEELDKQLAQMPALEVEVAQSQRPYRIRLQFANPYAYQGAQLIAAYDTLVRTVMTCRHIGLLDNEDTEGIVKLGARKVRGTFVVPQGYRLLGIDRNRLLRGSGRDPRACQLMGELPEEVLSGERRAPLVPRKVAFPMAVARSLALEPLSYPDRENHDG